MHGPSKAAQGRRWKSVGLLRSWETSSYDSSAYPPPKFRASTKRGTRLSNKVPMHSVPDPWSQLQTRDIEHTPTGRSSGPAGQPAMGTASVGTGSTV